MKQLIKDILEDIADSQPNLHSEAARENIATVIISAIRASAKGWYLDLNHSKEREEEDKKILESYLTDEQKTRISWVCNVCGKSTFEVEDDYLVHPKLHLGCALKEEAKGKDIKEQYLEVCEDTIERGEDRRKGDRREKNWAQKKHEDKVFGQDQEWPYDVKGNLLPNVTTTRNYNEVD